MTSTEKTWLFIARFVSRLLSLNQRETHRRITHNPLGISRGRNVRLADGVEGGTAEQVVICAHEVGVVCDGGLLVKPGLDLFEESLGGGRVASAVDIGEEGELCDPDLGESVLPGSAHGLRDKRLELLGVVAVPVHRQTADSTFAAAAHERTEPAQAHAGLRGGRHSGTDQLGLAGVGRDVLRVVRGGLLGAHVGLAGHVWLVEAHDVLAAAGQRCRER